MNLADFNISYQESESFLKETGLFRLKSYKILNRDGVSQEFKTASQKNDYFELYKIAKSKYDFDFLLNDESLFQFEFKEVGETIKIRYNFLQNPQEYVSYEEYLMEQSFSDEEIQQVGDQYIEEHGQFLLEQEINSSSISIRYDLDEKGYQPLLHSVAHFHIGHHNNIRIPCKKILTPLAFTVFVVKQVYVSDWKVFLSKKQGHNYLNFKDLCQNLEQNLWQVEEEKELFIS